MNTVGTLVNDSEWAKIKDLKLAKAMTFLKPMREMFFKTLTMIILDYQSENLI